MIDKTTVRELVIYCTNSADIYRRRVVPVCKNLARHKARGEYDAAKAARAFRHAIPDVLAGYGRDHCGHRFTISTAERDALAIELRDHYRDYVHELASNI